jgi:hypothetical protein
VDPKQEKAGSAYIKPDSLHHELLVRKEFASNQSKA